MGTDDGGLEDQVFAVLVLRHRREDAMPDALVAPAAEPAEGAVPPPNTSRRSPQGSVSPRARISIVLY